MIKEIVKDTEFLAKPSQTATKSDLEIGTHLVDTLNANLEGCVGLAANMIGYSKRVIVFLDDEIPTVMYNPEILKQINPFNTEEGCLSLVGVRETKRYEKIKVSYLNQDFQPRIKTFSGFTAQIIQHEVDHCNGIII